MTPTPEEVADERRNWMHRKWQRAPLRERLSGVRVPPVTGRGTQLARTARRLLEKEVAEAATVHVECVDLGTLSQEAVVVLPARREGAQMMILLPVHAGSGVLGQVMLGAAGRTAEARKAGTALARTLLRPVYGAKADVDVGTGARAAPVSYIAWRGAEIAVVARRGCRSGSAKQRSTQGCCGTTWLRCAAAS